jgi:predicted CXXCH cytochrome family protein
MHAVKGEDLFALPPNRKMLDPRTGQPLGTISALCLACHAETSQGGQGLAPVSGHLGHPFSLAKVNPRLARVPDELLRDGRFECVSCHDPHPSNPNYRYLRISTSKAPTLTELCSVCHPRKADPGAAPTKLFSSMDERAAR